MGARSFVKQLFNSVGLELIRLKNVPRSTFLGLSERGFNTVLDVGANDGGFARWASRVLPAARIHCFEPLPEPCRRLRKWASSRTPGAVTVHQLALSDHEGTAQMHEHLDHVTSSSLLTTTPTGQQMFPDTRRTADVPVVVTTLDVWAAGQNMDSPGRILLKLDVQGLEDRVLRGAVRTLPAVDVCITEVNFAQIYEGQAAFVDLVNLLSDAGLQYFGNLEQIHDERGAPIYADSVFVRHSAPAGRT